MTWYIGLVAVWVSAFLMVHLVRHLVDMHDYAEKQREEQERARWRRDRPE